MAEVGSINSLIRLSEIRYLLVGKTGRGKSSTANSILGENVFETNPNLVSCTMAASREFKIIENRQICVVDCPGLADTFMKKKLKSEGLSEEDINTKEFEFSVNNFDLALYFCQEGFHAIIMVFKFGERFTEEEINLVKILKFSLGPSVFEKYGICVFTHGDNFKSYLAEKSNDDEWVCPDNATLAREFYSYLREQTGEMETLLRSIKYRCVLFHNGIMAPPETKSFQRNTLFEMTDILSFNEGVFDSAIFDVMKQVRKDLQLTSGKDFVLMETEKQVSLLLHCIKGINRKIVKKKTIKDIESDIKDFKDINDEFYVVVNNFKEIKEYFQEVKLIFTETESLLSRMSENQEITDRDKEMLKEKEKTIKEMRKRTKIKIKDMKETAESNTSYYNKKAKILRGFRIGTSLIPFVGLLPSVILAYNQNKSVNSMVAEMKKHQELEKHLKIFST